ncbi:MAG: phosphoribosylformylglycinamidine synthase subunit PurL [Candidatus Kariarchaeaceae archaeon]
MPNDKEMKIIREKLGREPSRAEEAMFGSMWSEHCSYKSSKHWFKLFSGVTSPRVRLGIGEGAGLIDIGDGQLIGLALESHNHPSAIDPFNGAATGVGGIIRDVISQGCKPIALLDSLRFGDIEQSKHSQYLLDNAVRGISSYGNCVGIPNIGGDIAFDPSYETNCLINVMCIGIVKEEDVVRSKAEKEGEILILFGSSTGRDGIGGVSFASETLTDESDEDRPAVQIGDPAQEKILIDIIEELISEKLITGMQDLGGGGFTCATSEIVFGGRKGAKINIDKIPLREEGMAPWEIMISESQERMLVVVSPDKVDAVCEILKRYEINFGIVGEIIEEDRYLAENSKGEVIADLEASFLVDGFPEYHHPYEAPEEYLALKEVTRGEEFFDQFAQDIFNSPNLAKKNFVYDQYDKHVQIRTMVESGDNAGVLDLGNKKAIGAVLDTNDHQVMLDPREGTIRTVIRNCGKLYASGLEPITAVDCLNFGNPEMKDSYWQFVESIHGLATAIKTYNLPIVGGNVSLYNESESGGKRLRINPTPTVGVVGLTTDNSRITRGKIKQSNSKIIIIGSTGEDLGGSEAIRYCDKSLGKINPSTEKDIQLAQKNGERVKQLIDEGIILSAKNISRGGLFASLAKMLFETGKGAKVTSEQIPAKEGLIPNLTALFFGETPGRFLLEIEPEKEQEVVELLGEVAHAIIGQTTDNNQLIINEKEYLLSTLEKQWKEAIEKHMVI